MDENGQACSGIAVVLNSTPKTTVTNSAGIFSFSHVPATTHNLGIYSGGSRVGSNSINLSRSGAAASKSIDDDGNG